VRSGQAIRGTFCFQDRVQQGVFPVPALKRVVFLECTNRYFLCKVRFEGEGSLEYRWRDQLMYGL
jgi:hypothetical protein